MTRLSLRWLPLAAALLAAPAWAQQPPTPEETTQRKARAAAKAATEEAYELLEDYGRAVPAPPPTRKRLRSLGLRRISDPRAEPPKSAQAAPFDPFGDTDELRACRELILERLNALDRDRFPLPERPRREPPGPLELKIFDVQDLVLTPSDYFAPEVGLGNSLFDSGGAGGGVLSFSDDWESTQGVGVRPDKLIELIETELGEDSERGSVEYTSGRLIVRKTVEEIGRIQAVLDRIGENRGGLVDLEVRLYRMPPTLFAKLRASASALTAKGEAALARATADGRATLLSKHRVVAHDGQQVHVRRGGSRSFVADVTVNQTGVVPVTYPVVNILNEGLLVELRPIVDRERKVVLVDAALSLSGLHDPVETRMVEGVEIELPKMSIARTGSSTCVPLGRGALLGGVFRIDGEDGKPQTCVVYVRPNLVQGR